MSLTMMMMMNLMKATKISSWIRVSKTLHKSGRKAEIKLNQDLESRAMFKVSTVLGISNSIPLRLMMKRNSFLCFRIIKGQFSKI
jgi:hypothetical protein